MVFRNAGAPPASEARAIEKSRLARLASASLDNAAGVAVGAARITRQTDELERDCKQQHFAPSASFAGLINLVEDASVGKMDLVGLLPVSHHVREREQLQLGKLRGRLRRDLRVHRSIVV